MSQCLAGPSCAEWSPVVTKNSENMRIKRSKRLMMRNKKNTHEMINLNVNEYIFNDTVKYNIVISLHLKPARYRSLPTDSRAWISWRQLVKDEPKSDGNGTDTR